MKKVLYFDAPREKYHSDAAILWCFDNRFELGFRKFLKRIGIIYSDPIKIAGGAKCMASPELETDREFVLEQIRKSMRLHGTRRVILMLHSDCGAYGGLAGRFGGNALINPAALIKTNTVRRSWSSRRSLVRTRHRSRRRRNY